MQHSTMARQCKFALKRGWSIFFMLPAIGLSAFGCSSDGPFSPVVEVIESNRYSLRYERTMELPGLRTTIKAVKTPYGGWAEFDDGRVESLSAVLARDMLARRFVVGVFDNALKERVAVSGETDAIPVVAWYNRLPLPEQTEAEGDAVQADLEDAGAVVVRRSSFMPFIYATATPQVLRALES